jgi:long-chain acyl-CoA synthetase
MALDSRSSDPDTTMAWSPPHVMVDGCDTFAKLFRAKCRERGAAIALREKEFGIWHDFSWSQYYQYARRVGCALLTLGFQNGDVAAILSEDNKEWVFTDLGIQGVRASCHGIYPTLQARQLAYQLNDSKARVLFVEDEEQLDKYLSAEADMPLIETVVVYDMEGLRRFKHDKVMSWEAFLALGDEDKSTLEEEWERRIDGSQQEDIAILIYTSGTTGEPKGALISNRYLLVQADRYPELPLGPGDEVLTFLPLCHGAERIFSVAIPIRYGVIINFAESGETFAQDLQEVAPTMIFAVPRVWEKFYSQINFIMQDATAFGRWAYKLALAVSGDRLARLEQGKRVPGWLSLSHSVLDWAVLRNIRVLLGLDRAHEILSGAAPISANLLSWFNALGVTVREAYGQTETGVITVTIPGSSPIGSVGRALKDVEIEIAETGEILARSANNFSGYLNAPQKTAETMIDGWIQTGDVGRMDENGDLYILDRIKDIIVTAGGKNITPSLLENELKFSPYIADAVIIGDKRKYLSALIMIDLENVEKYAQENRIPFTDYKSLCASEEVRELVSRQVDNANSDFSSVEQVKRFELINVLLTAEDEELTPTMKLKRREVERKYAGLIDGMY